MLYKMNDVLEVAKAGTLDITNFLLSRNEVKTVTNVEDNKYWQKQDVDLIVNVCKINQVKQYKIEIKCDRWYKTGNYFFETISNKNKNTQGCFMYTTADYIYYYFIEPKELHILPMPLTREWFIENMHRFQTKLTGTKVGNDYYPSEGKIVPRNIVKNEIKGLKIIQL